MTAAVRVRCPAKVNLGLWVLGRRADGFHEIDTILQSVDLEDLLELERVPGGAGIELRCLGRRVEGRNLVERAWDLLVSLRPALAKEGLRARLTKRIPVGAGLGGGSSDAAGLLVGANRLFGLGLAPAGLERAASQLGSDVPFFLRGGTARARGRGDQVRHIGPLPPTWAVLVSPPFAVSTSWAYGLLRKQLTAGGLGASILASAVAHGDVGATVEARWNAFEDVVLPHFPRLAAMRCSLIAAGAWGPLLSGSGASLFTLARSEVEAREVASALAGQDAEIRVVRTRERGVIVSQSA